VGIDAGIAEVYENSLEEGFVPTGIVAQGDAAVALVMDVPGLCLGREDESEACRQGEVGEPRLHIGFNPNSNVG
jgi:hypothetical protein